MRPLPWTWLVVHRLHHAVELRDLVMGSVPVNALFVPVSSDTIAVLAECRRHGEAAPGPVLPDDAFFRPARFTAEVITLEEFE